MADFERMLVGRIMRKRCVFVKVASAAPRLLKHRRPAQYCNGTGRFRRTRAAI